MNESEREAARSVLEDLSVRQLRSELERVTKARDGDSNDEHVSALEDALSTALARWPEVELP